jgi:AcrR family transcriptional regulator
MRKARIRPIAIPRRERRRAETRKKLRCAAFRLFGQKGYLQTTVEDITEAADVGKGTFFNYFPTKEHVLATFGDEPLAIIERAVARSKREPVMDVFRKLFRELASQANENSELSRAIFVAHASRDAVRAKLRERLPVARRLLAEMLALAQERGEVRSDIRAGELATLMQLISFGMVVRWTMISDRGLP